MLILSGNWQNTSSFHVKDKKLRNYDLLEERYDKVCVSGDLSDGFDFGANVLPKGFYGSYINKGIFEIGYKAGVEENNTLPFIDVGYTGFISISVEFEHDLKDFKRATFIGGVGFELVIYNPKNGYKIQRSVYEHEYFKDAFSINDGNEYQYIDGKLPSTMSLSYKVDIKTLCFHLYLDEGDRISFLRYYYSDITEPVSNCSITKYGYDISVRNNHSCSKYSYVDKYGLNPVLELRSEYGTLYNKNYLFNLFSRYDYINKRVYYPDKIIDYDNYFESGYFAEIGSKFTIDFIEIDITNNKEVVIATINILIIDTMPPVIYQREPWPFVTMSYKDDANSKRFINENFIIKDNIEAEVKTKVTLENGQDIPRLLTGRFSCILTATDIFNNTSTFKFDLDIIDDVSPEILCKCNELFLTVDETLTEDELYSMFEVFDDIDTELEINIIENTYLNHENEVGRYNYTLLAKDTSNNIAIKELKIYVQEGDKPIWWANDTYINVKEGKIPTLDEIIQSLIRNETIPNRKYIDFQISGDEEFESLSVGIHSLTIKLVDDVGLTTAVNVIIKVDEADKLISAKIEQNISFWQRIVDFFKSIWNKIIAFFKGK